MRASAYLLRKSAPAAVGMPRSVHMHGHSGLNPMFPRPPMLDGAGNGTSARPRRGRTSAVGSLLGVTETMGEDFAGFAAPEVSRARWSGQRDVRVFASQIRTGFRRLPAPSPARYKRFAFALRSHPVGFESRHFIEKSTAPERCRAFTFLERATGLEPASVSLGS